MVGNVDAEADALSCFKIRLSSWCKVSYPSCCLWFVGSCSRLQENTQVWEIYSRQFRFVAVEVFDSYDIPLHRGVAVRAPRTKSQHFPHGVATTTRFTPGPRTNFSHIRDTSHFPSMNLNSSIRQPLAIPPLFPAQPILSSAPQSPHATFSILNTPLPVLKTTPALSYSFVIAVVWLEAISVLIDEVRSTWTRDCGLWWDKVGVG